MVKIIILILNVILVGYFSFSFVMILLDLHDHLQLRNRFSYLSVYGGVCYLYLTILYRTIRDIIHYKRQ